MFKKTFILMIFCILGLNAADPNPLSPRPVTPSLRLKKVIFITGTSCAGKSTIISELKQRVANEDEWHFIAADNLEDMPGIKTDKYSKLTYDDAIILNQIVKYGKTFNIICDTILYYAEEIDEIKNFLIEKGAEPYIVLVHTDLENLEQRVNSRKLDTNSPQCDGTSFAKALEDYGSLYKVEKSQTPRSVSRISPLTITHLQRRHSETDIEQSLNKIKGKYFPDLEDESLEEECYVVPTYDYDLVVDTSLRNDAIAEISKLME